MENITINGEAFTYCDGKFTDTGEHAPIYLAGHFRALCPLCAARLAVENAEEKAANGAAVLVEDAENATRDMEKFADNTTIKLRALGNIIENVSERLAGVTAENVVAVSRDVRCDMLEALAAVRRMPGADV